MRRILIGLTCLLAGCTSYRYDAAVGGNPPMAVQKETDLVLPAGLVELRLRQVESRCVLLVVNRNDADVTLVGEKSALVDPRGQSHAVGGQLIPPNSHVKFVLPPLRDTTPSGPTIGIGFGVLVENDAPRNALYLTTSPVPDYWDWPGEGEIRLTLSVRKGEAEEGFTVRIGRKKA
jgi:hypothetical protein